MPSTTLGTIIKPPLKVPMYPDANENGLGNMHQAWQYWFGQLQAVANSPARATFTYTALTAALETSHVRVPSEASYAITALDINAVGVPTGSDAIFDIQMSKDDTVWTSVLTAPAHLAAGAKFATTISAFAVTQIPAGYFLRAVVAGGSGLTATSVTLELSLDRIE